MKIDNATFDGWVKEHQRLLFRIAYWWVSSRSDAEDLVQETFLEAYRSRNNLRDQELLKPWLIGILRNNHSQLRRRQMRTEASSLDLIVEPQGPSSIRTDHIALHQALQQLDAIHRLPLVLFYFEELSYRDISVALDVPIGTVMSRMSRSRRELFEKLRPQSKEEIEPGVIQQ